MTTQMIARTTHVISVVFFEFFFQSLILLLFCLRSSGKHLAFFAEHPAAPRGPCLVQGTSCFQSGPAWSWSGPGLHPWSGPGPILVRSDPVPVRSGPGPVRSGPGPVSFGREDGSVRVRVRR